MAYQKPLVMVFQEYAKLSVATQAATLYPCIVGPCYTVIDTVEDDILAYVADYTDAGLPDTLFPNLPAGAEVEASSVEIRMKDPVVQLSDAPVAVASIEDNVLTFAEADYPADIEVGDIFTITDVTDTLNPVQIAGEFLVLDTNATAFTIFLNKSPVTGTGTDFEVEQYREVSDITLDESSDALVIDVTSDSFALTGVQSDVNGTSKVVDRASVYAGYRALRTDLTGINTVYDPDEAKGLLGKLDTHDNPLGLGVATALANTTVGVKVIGVASDDVTGFTAAKDRLETYDDVYAIVPLSQDSAILGIFSAHATQMSQPEQGNWRVAIGNVEIPDESTLQEGNGETKVDGDGDLILLSDLNAQFLTNDVSPGDELRIINIDSEEEVYTVDTVISEDLLSIDPTTPFDNISLASGTPYPYEIVDILNRTEQATAVKQISESFGSQRFIHTFPDTCEIGGVQVPGYYLSCTVAGATGGLPSHRGFTRLSVAGIERLHNSGDHFNQDQLDIIADGGTFIFTQANPQAAPVIRHQLTTDMSTIEMAEFSFVKNFDYVSMLCKDALDRFLGQYNITPSTLGILETAVRSVLESLKLYTLPRIGAPVLGYEIVEVKQLDDIRDRVEMYANVTFPYPLNTVGLHLVSQ